MTISKYILMGFAVAMVTSGAVQAACNCDPTTMALHLRTQQNVKQFIDNEYRKHKQFLEQKFWNEKLEPALQEYTQQEVMSTQERTKALAAEADAAAANKIAVAVGEKQAENALTYQPNPQVCGVASGVRNLALASAVGQEVVTETTTASVDRRLAIDVPEGKSPQEADIDARRETLTDRFCDPDAWGGAMRGVCKQAGDLKNRDITYRDTVDAPWTLDIRPDYTSKDKDEWTNDEVAVDAMRTNLFGHELYPRPTAAEFKNRDVQIGYMNQRALEAKRNVAQYSFDTLVGQKAAGSEAAKQWLEASLSKLGLQMDDETRAKIKDKPSYYAIMEVLTKRMYQDPNFYNNLIQPGPQVAQTQASLQAVGLMQMRDVYESMLRSELILSLIVEMELGEQQEVVQRNTDR